MRDLDLRLSLRRLGICWALLLLSACGTSDDQDESDGAEDELVGCLETPSTLPRPPTGKLPCELIPPGLKL